MRHYQLKKRKIIYKLQSDVILCPFWMVGHGLVDEVTGYVDDVNTFMVDLERSKGLCYSRRCLGASETWRRNKNGTIAVSSRAMRRVPVTRRKMMKMLMILSRERSNHTIIYIQ